jgi:hypothetical protein
MAVPRVPSAHPSEQWVGNGVNHLLRLCSLADLVVQSIQPKLMEEVLIYCKVVV